MASLIESIIALARVSGGGAGNEGGKPAAKPTGTSSEPIGKVAPENAGLQIDMLKTLGRLEGHQLNTAQTLASLRALQLVLIRLGKPDADVCAAIAEKLDKLILLNKSYLLNNKKHNYNKSIFLFQFSKNTFFIYQKE